MLKAANNERDKLIIFVFYDSGVRKAELIELKISDIDFEEETITVRKGKGDKSRIVPVSSSLITKLANFINKKSEKEVNKEYLFLSNRLDKLCKRRINDIVGNLRKKAGIEKNITPHSLRRTFATIWYNENDHDIYALRDIMGHASIKTTEKYI